MERTIIESKHKKIWLGSNHMKKRVSKLNKNIYPKGKNPFAGLKVANFKKTLVYPNEGSIRFQIQIDKNNQIYEIRRSYAQVIKDAETKKRFIKVTLGERPKDLYERVKGRPLVHAVCWIEEYIESCALSEEYSPEEEEA